ncbi:MAG: indolepyruvate oxidoreductase subunit beta [Desulfatiglans sp.]|jgi:indolepyruvate ferredoxin oxidoreductase beta subunit|nr:indolepyruvate oxidoreductase subunit beta [Thermodesulfobacteriota bacterium]MEE4352100.1 indolepyruvate oxidoreductase subunit beta [Desulfatiglans sp.]
MPINLIITGVGGQGNVLASQILGRAAIGKGFQVTVGETFGLSQRGGPVMSHIRLSRDRNYGPIIPPNLAHIIVGLEPLETIRVLGDFANEQTTFLVNARPIYPLNAIAGDIEYPDMDWMRGILEESGKKLYWIEATRMAMDLGGPIMLNMIMVGALCGLSDFPIQVDDVKNVLGDIFPESKLPSNHKALDIGRDLTDIHEN